MKAYIWIAVVALSGCLPAAHSQSVQRVEIESLWGGFGPPSRSSLAVGPEKGAAIARLVAAINEPVIAVPRAENLGLTPEWVAENADQVGRAHVSVYGEAAQNQKELFQRSMKDAGLLKIIVERMCTMLHTDDSPSLTARITFEDGSVTTVRSDAQAPFMLPWRLEPGGIVTFNADISRALGGLMPDGTTNRERLNGWGRDDAVGYALMEHIQPAWNLLDAENRAGDALREIRKGYRVQAAEVNWSHHPEYGKDWTGGEPHEENLHAELRREGFPSNVAYAVVLERVNGKVEGAVEFVRSASAYVTRALSIPWLAAYIRTHPAVPVRICYVHNASFGDKAWETFAADMRAKGRDDLARVVKAARKEIVLLRMGQKDYGAYWLVLPDGRLMLWRFEGPSGLLKWAPTDFPTGPCGDYRPSFGGCAGSIVSVDGELVADSFKPDEACVAAYRAGHAKPSVVDQVLFPIHDPGRSGFIDQRGNVVVPLCFQAVGSFGEGLASFARDGLWGFVDASGSVVMEPQFRRVRPFFEGIAAVQRRGAGLYLDGPWLFIDRRGVAVPGEFEAVDSIREEDEGFHDGMAMVRVNGRLGFVDRAGRLVVEPRYFLVHPFSEGLAAVSVNGEQWGYIDKRGAWTIPARFEGASPFSEGLAAINRTHDCAYIDRTGGVP